MSLYQPQPHFYQTTQVSDIARQIAQLNPHKAKAIFRAAPQEGSEPIAGVTYFPPNTLDPRVVAPPAPKQHLMMAAAVAPTTMPSYFCWADRDNVAQVKGWGKRPAELGEYTSPVPNQKTCGSCWAVSSASVFSDRWAIFTQSVNPQLSATDILSCVSNQDGSALVTFDNCHKCDGGLPAGAAAFFARYGVVTSQCLPYDWCTRNQVCAGKQSSQGEGGNYLNSLVPRCKRQPCPNTQRYKAKFYTSTAPPKLAALSFERPAAPGTFQARQLDMNTSAALSVTGIADIQREILANGPVVGAMAIYLDFQAGTSPGSGNWAPTKNVYCNVQRSGANKPYSNTPYAQTENQLQGYHAVSVIGWGVEKDVDDWTMPGRKFDLPYWIVRNSWGTEWNTGCTVNNGKVKLPGHFKIAWTNQSKNINTRVHLDTTANGELGGTTAFEPAVLRAPPPSGGNNNKTAQQLFTYDAASKQCVAAPDGQYNSLIECIQANPGAQKLTYKCNYVKNTCTAVTNGSGKYVDADVCARKCGKDHTTFLALVITGSILVVAAVAIGVGVSVSKKKPRLA